MGLAGVKLPWVVVDEGTDLLGGGVYLKEKGMAGEREGKGMTLYLNLESREGGDDGLDRERALTGSREGKVHMICTGMIDNEENSKQLLASIRPGTE